MFLFVTRPIFLAGIILETSNLKRRPDDNSSLINSLGRNPIPKPALTKSFIREILDNSKFGVSFIFFFV